MKTTADFLDDLRVRLDAPSDSKLAAAMGWERQQVSHYRLKKQSFDDQTAVKVARQLGIAPDYIMACMAAQRAKTPETRSAWERIAAKVAACIVLGIALQGAPSPAPAAFDINTSTEQTRPALDLSIHMQQRRRRKERGASRWKWAWELLSALVRALGLALVPAAPAVAGDWSGADTAREAAYQTLLAVDCAQTRYGASHPDQFTEANPLMGEHPSKGKINSICFGVGLGHYLISRWIPHGDGRTVWQGVTIGIELWAVDTNRMAGVKIEF